ncbi:hypothetical protein INR49_010124, partial [Caranx melampygus]
MENPFKEPQKGCILCNVQVDYKNIQLLSQFISPHTGRIYGRHITGLCGRKQKEVSKAIKKAHAMGFMSVTHKHPQFMKDPNSLLRFHCVQNGDDVFIVLVFVVSLGAAADGGNGKGVE